VEGDGSSRNRNAFKTFPALSSVIAAAIPHQAVVDLSAICAGTPAAAR
jgi:hypothetical protein